MHRNVWGQIGGVLGTLVVVAGCRTGSQLVQEPRVDLGTIAGGNRGYLMGVPPEAAGPSKTTRQMIQTDIELPTRFRANRQAPGSVGLQELAPPETDLGEAGEVPQTAEPDTYDTYRVKAGDTLWSIAADVYGDAGNWRRIFDANRKQLRSPDRLRAGLTLRIPRGAAHEGSEPDASTAPYSK